MRGSPPRVRGTVLQRKMFMTWVRITPAGAGNRMPKEDAIELAQDHPRGCGEQLGFLFATVSRHGSPPRVRGTDLFILRIIAHTGITPAGAGNRRFQGRYRAVKGDHPRGCGEQMNYSVEDTSLAGSPPRVRGTERRYNEFKRNRGITPAGAGNSVDFLYFLYLR